MEILIGGHTAEMMNLLSVLQMDRFTPRFYIAAATDNMSLQKARVFEDSLLHEVGCLIWHFLNFVYLFIDFLSFLLFCSLFSGSEYL